MRKLFLLTPLNLCIVFALQAQTMTYKANKWGNTKMYKSWTTALDNPVLEKVMIIHTNKTIKITFGGKRALAYTVINSEKIGSTTIKYNVKMNDKSYSIKQMFIDNAYYFICENEWAVAEITDVSSTETALKPSSGAASNIDTLGRPYFMTTSYTCENPRSSGNENVVFFFAPKSIYIKDRSGFQTYKIIDVSKNEWGSSIYLTRSQKGNPYEIKVMRSNYGDTAIIQTTSVNGTVIKYFRN